MWRASIDRQEGWQGLTTWQLRLLGSLVASGTPAAFAIAAALLDIPVWPFALIGVGPGLLLGAIYGPFAARTDQPLTAAVFIGFVGFFAGLAIDLLGLWVLAHLGFPEWLTEATVIVAWGFVAFLLGGIPASLLVSFGSVATLRVLSAMRPRQVATAVMFGVALLIAAGSAALGQVRARVAVDEARYHALRDGPVRLSIDHANLSRSWFDVVVTYPATGWTGTAETFGPCESGSGGFRLQPGWELHLQPTAAEAGPAQLIATAETDPGEMAFVRIVVGPDGSVSTMERLPSPGDPRWDDCVG